MKESDNIYITDVSDGKPNGNLCKSIPMNMERFQASRPKLRGLAIDPTNSDLLVLANRGTRVDRGMPIGFYEGYTKEIHELYIYKKVK
ncbi:Uncharacterised protein [Fusobacterium necrophorum subsp. necrophorum]|nr:Uncharacterised protein [Fusobacterium necrophorum subsp. necrophorum]